VPGGWTCAETVELSKRLKGCDFVHVSSGGVSTQQKIALGPGYQLAFAREVKQKTGMPTISVGLITDPHQAEAVIANGDSDLVALARAFLYNPRWGWHAAAALGGTVDASKQYWRCPPREAGGIFGATSIGQR
jgi:2,4-dienoyl-CoA reductase-like NADH-dependent reductase (Old Yellow Enzyme family)